MKVTVNEKGKRRILGGHPWVFRSDVEIQKDLSSGVITVIDRKGAPLGQALHSPHSQITLRMITRRQERVDEAFWRERIGAAASFRESLGIPSNAYRVVFGESDGIPSFILDRYGEAYVFQILSAGLEAERVPLLRAVELLFRPKLLVERNDVLVRNLEKLPLSSQVLQGESSTLVLVTEGDLQFEVDLLEGQKTGAFLDQRDNRFQAAFFAREKKRILDAFSYQGWFACHMGKEAGSVMALEQSGPACRQIQRNCELNRIENVSVTEANAFDFLKEADQRKERFNLINLDPPAFVKSRHQLSQALRGYKEINLRAMKLLEKDGILITSSCSHHLSEEEFLNVIRESALDAKRQVQILRVGQQASDHPILIGFPESRYLKCFFLRVL